MKTDTNDTSLYASVSDVAGYFEMTEATVREWAKKESIPAIKIGKQWFFPRDWFEKQKQITKK